MEGSKDEAMGERERCSRGGEVSTSGDEEEEVLLRMIANFIHFEQWEAARAAAFSLPARGRRRLGFLLKALIEDVRRAAQKSQDGGTVGEERSALAGWQAVVLHRAIITGKASEGDERLHPSIAFTAEIALLLSLIGRPEVTELEDGVGRPHAGTKEDGHIRRVKLLLTSFFGINKEEEEEEEEEKEKEEGEEGIESEIGEFTGSATDGVDAKETIEDFQWLTWHQPRLTDALRRAVLRAPQLTDPDVGNPTLNRHAAPRKPPISTHLSQADLMACFDRASMQSAEGAIDGLRHEKDIDKGGRRNLDQLAGSRLCYLLSAAGADDINRIRSIVDSLIQRGGLCRRRAFEATIGSGNHGLSSVVEDVERIRAFTAAGLSGKDGSEELSDDETISLLSCSNWNAVLHTAISLKVPLALRAVERAVELMKDDFVEKGFSVLLHFPELLTMVAVMVWDAKVAQGVDGTFLARTHQILEHAMKNSGNESHAVHDICKELLHRLQACELLAQHLVVPKAQSGLGSPSATGDDHKESQRNLEATLIGKLETSSPLRTVADYFNQLPPKMATAILYNWPASPGNRTFSSDSDTELLHMATVISGLANAFTCVNRSTSSDQIDEREIVRDLQLEFACIEYHLPLITSTFRKAWTLEYMSHMMRMESTAIKSEPIGKCTDKREYISSTRIINDVSDEDSLPVMFISGILSILRNSSRSVEVEDILALDRNVQRVVEDRMTCLTNWLEEAEWRLSILRRMSRGQRDPGSFPVLSGGYASNRLETALAMMRAPPRALTLVLLRQEKLELAAEAVSRHKISEADADESAVGKLVDKALACASVEAILISLSSGKINSGELAQKFDEINNLLPGITQASMYLDFAATSADSTPLATELIQRAQQLLQQHNDILDCKHGSSDDEKKMYIICAHACTLLQQLVERHDKSTPLHECISEVERLSPVSDSSPAAGERFDAGSSPSKISCLDCDESTASYVLSAYARCRNLRALQLLDDFVSDRSIPHFISGVLHNLAHALEEEGVEPDEQATIWSVLKGSQKIDSLPPILCKSGGYRNAAFEQNQGESSEGIETAYSGTAFHSVLSLSYLSTMLRYIADLGDVMASLESGSESYNNLEILQRTPTDLLSTIVFEKGNFEAAVSAAGIMQKDLLKEILPLCIDPIRPPLVSEAESLQDKVVPVLTQQRALQLIRHLAAQSPLRALLACSLGLLPRTMEDTAESNTKQADKELEEEIVNFTLEQSSTYPALNRWVQLQSKAYSLRSQMKWGETRNSLDHGTDYSADLIGDDPLPSENLTKRESVHSGRIVHLNDDYSAIWEDESVYLEHAHLLVSNGDFEGALNVADTWLQDGAPDELLLDIIDTDSAHDETTENSADGNNLGWHCCIRLRNPLLAARCILMHHGRWPYDEAVEALDLVALNLQEYEDEDEEEDTNQLKRIVEARVTLVKRYGIIKGGKVKADNWAQRVADWDARPLNFAKRLIENGAFNEAISLCRERGLDAESRKDLLVQRLNSLLVDGFLSAEEIEKSISYLSVEEAWEAVRVLLQDLRSRRLRLFLITLVENAFKKHPEEYPDVESAVHRARMGHEVLAMLPPTWAQRTAALAETPELIVEMLLMGQQISHAQGLLARFPELLNTDMILRYVTKALASTGTTPSKLQGGRESQADTTVDAGALDDRLSNRLNSALESGSSLHAPMVNLKGDPELDAQLREEHIFPKTPDTTLTLSLIELIPDKVLAASEVVSICQEKFEEYFKKERIEENNLEIDVANVIADSLVKVIEWCNRIFVSPRYTLDADAEMRLKESEILSGKIELIRMLLGVSVVASADDLSNLEKVLLLQERLVDNEHYNLAIFVGVRYRLNTSWIWERWGMACLDLGSWTDARQKFARCMAEQGEDKSARETIVRKIILSIESGPVVDLSELRQEYALFLRSTVAKHNGAMVSRIGSFLIPSLLKGKFDYSTGGETGVTRKKTLSLEESKFYIREHCPSLMPEFGMRHGELQDAVDSTLEQMTEETKDASIARLCTHAIKYERNAELLRVLSDLPENERDGILKSACKFLSRNGNIDLLYDYQICLGHFHAAALSCLQLYFGSGTCEKALEHLENAHKLLDVALGEQQERRLSGATADGASDANILRLSARVQLQMEVLKCGHLQTEQPAFVNLLGSDGFSVQQRRRSVAETIAEKDFDLAFRIVSEFRLSAVEIFSCAARKLAGKGQVNDIVALVHSTRGAMTDEERDAILGSAVMAFVRQDTPPQTSSMRSITSIGSSRLSSARKLISVFSSTRRQVMGAIACEDLRTAFDIAAAASSIADVILVEQESSRVGLTTVTHLCEQWLEDNNA